MNLYPFQRTGVDFLRTHRRAYLADEMGLGKTVQSLTAAREVGVRNVLAVAPAAAVGNWYEEHHEWGDPSWNFAAVSYADRLVRSGTVEGGDWDLVLMDEAHYMKSRTAKRTRNGFRIARDAPRAWLLSGTPMPNHAGELWAPVNALWPDLIPGYARRYDQWLRYFCRFTNTRYGPRVYGHKNAPELKALLRRFMLRRKLDDVAVDLPPLRVTMHTLPRLEDLVLDVEAERALRGLLHEDAKEDPALSRVRRLLGEAKAASIADLIHGELKERQYKKIVVIYQHTRVGDIFVDKLRDFSPVRLFGGTKKADRQGVIEQFKTDPSTRVFVGQIATSGTALNLQVASELALVEPSWVPDENRQVIKRIHRLGQTRPCRARVFGVDGSLDQQVMRVVTRKANNQKEIGL